MTSAGRSSSSLSRSGDEVFGSPENVECWVLAGTYLRMHSPCWWRGPGPWGFYFHSAFDFDVEPASTWRDGRPRDGRLKQFVKFAVVTHPC